MLEAILWIVGFLVAVFILGVIKEAIWPSKGGDRSSRMKNGGWF